MVILRNKSFSKKGEMTKTQKQDLKDELKAAGTGFLSFIPLAERSYNKYNY